MKKKMLKTRKFYLKITSLPNTKTSGREYTGSNTHKLEMATASQEAFVFPSWPNLFVFTYITGAQNTWTFPGRDDNPAFWQTMLSTTNPWRTAWAQHMATSSSSEKCVLAGFSRFSDLLVTNKL